MIRTAQYSSLPDESVDEMINGLLHGRRLVPLPSIAPLTQLIDRKLTFVGALKLRQKFFQGRGITSTKPIEVSRENRLPGGDYVGFD